MNTIKNTLHIAALACALAIPLGGLAQVGADQGKTSETPMAVSMSDGEVRKVDADAGKVTIKHGHIKHLDMPGMTMVFTAKDKNLLTNIKSGDKIKFMVINEEGRMVVTDIQPTR